MTGLPPEAATFTLRLDQSAAGATVWAAGELDLAAAEPLRHTLEALARRGRVILDLTDVTFVDGAALGAVVAARKDAGDDAEVVLRNPRGIVERVLRLTQLDTAFPIEPARAEGPA